MPQSCAIGVLRQTSSDEVWAVNPVQAQALEWGGRLGGKKKGREETRKNLNKHSELR